MIPKHLSSALLALTALSAVLVFSCHKNISSNVVSVLLSGPDSVYLIDSAHFAVNDSLVPPGASYSWNFGDGTTATTAMTTHAYRRPGSYTVNVTVKGGNTELTASKTIRVVYLKSDYTQHMGGTRKWNGITVFTSTRDTLRNKELAINVVDAGRVSFAAVSMFSDPMYCVQADTVVDHVIVFSDPVVNKTMRYYYLRDSISYYAWYQSGLYSEHVDIHSP